MAIDGPAGAGKSTLARSLAGVLGVPYVNTGAMYRAVAARALADGVGADDRQGLERATRALRFELDGRHPPEVAIGGLPAGSDLTAPEVEAVVSTTSRHPAVRGALRERQRELAAGGCVMEGRDIGTVVLPDAQVKIFLWAGEGERAVRRAGEREVRPAGVQEVAAAVARRDELDAGTNPFVPAPDAHLLDTTGLPRPAVLARALALVRDLAPPGTWPAAPDPTSPGAPHPASHRTEAPR